MQTITSCFIHCFIAIFLVLLGVIRTSDIKPIIGKYTMITFRHISIMVQQLIFATTHHLDIILAKFLCPRFVITGYTCICLIESIPKTLRWEIDKLNTR